MPARQMRRWTWLTTCCEETGDPASRARAFELLDRAAATDSLEAKFRLASLLASDADESRRDPRRALEAARAGHDRQGDRSDRVRNPRRGQRHAGRLQGRAERPGAGHSDLAAKYGWDLAPQKALLEKYQNNAAWTGDLLAL